MAEMESSGLEMEGTVKELAEKVEALADALEMSVMAEMAGNDRIEALEKERAGLEQQLELAE
eukprot:1230948-Rhodomonas_salina.1